MGFDAFFFWRLDYRDKDQRFADKSMEFLWRPFKDSLGKRADILAHAFEESYFAPTGFDVDQDGGNADPIVVNPKLSTYNKE